MREDECFISMFVLDQMKAHNRELRKTDRDLVRDRHKLEAEEQRLVRMKFLCGRNDPVGIV